MPYPSQKILVFVCILLCACAAGMSEETEPVELVAVPEANPALVLDAAQPFVPSVVSSTPDSALTSTPTAPSIPQSPIPTSPASPSVPSTTPVDAAAADSAVADASMASSDASAPTPSADGGASDAGTSASSDASTTPSAPMCVVEQCTNNCLLLPRCCNEQNQCACYSVLRRSCSLSSL